MISYNWGHQETALKLKDPLQKHGIHVWMDVEGGIQTGDINKAMASGVEKGENDLYCCDRILEYARSTFTISLGSSDVNFEYGFIFTVIR